jgi:hypothetical protein
VQAWLDEGMSNGDVRVETEEDKVRITIVWSGYQSVSAIAPAGPHLTDLTIDIAERSTCLAVALPNARARGGNALSGREGDLGRMAPANNVLPKRMPRLREGYRKIAAPSSGRRFGTFPAAFPWKCPRIGAMNARGRTSPGHGVLARVTGSTAGREDWPGAVASPAWTSGGTGPGHGRKAHGGGRLVSHGGRDVRWGRCIGR